MTVSANMIRASPRLVARQMDHFLDDLFFLDYDELLDRCCDSSIPTLNISGFQSGFIFNLVIFERFLSAFKGVWGWVGHGFQESFLIINESQTLTYTPKRLDQQYNPSSSGQTFHAA